MTYVRMICVLGAVLLLGTTACGADKNDNKPASTPTRSQRAPESQAPSVAPSVAPPASTNGLKVATTGAGDVIVDGEGHTAYMYTKDVKDSGKSACYDQCAIAWPPLIAAADPPTEVGVTGKVATIARTDGGKQITANGWPLYLYAKDAKPGDTTGQKVGNVWFVLKPDGTPIK